MALVIMTIEAVDAETGASFSMSTGPTTWASAAVAIEHLMRRPWARHRIPGGYETVTNLVSGCFQRVTFTEES